MELRIATVDELIDAEAEARIAARRTARGTDVMRGILRLFVDGGNPITLETIAAALPGRPPEAVRDAVAALEQEDLVVLRDSMVRIAYPFSAAMTAFTVRWPDGRARYACCAIDALGMAPMLGHPVHVSSRCHHCGSPLELSVGTGGPGPEAQGLMVWIGKRPEGEECVADSL